MHPKLCMHVPVEEGREAEKRRCDSIGILSKLSLWRWSTGQKQIEKYKQRRAMGSRYMSDRTYREHCREETSL